MTVASNPKFNHRSTEKSLSNFAMSQLLEVYEYFPKKTTTDGLPENHRLNGKETHLIQTSIFFWGKKALSFRWSFHGIETYPSRNNRFYPAFQRSQERKP